MSADEVMQPDRGHALMELVRLAGGEVSGHGPFIPHFPQSAKKLQDGRSSLFNSG